MNLFKTPFNEVDHSSKTIKRQLEETFKIVTFIDMLAILICVVIGILKLLTLE